MLGTVWYDHFAVCIELMRRSKTSDWWEPRRSKIALKDVG